MESKKRFTLTILWGLAVLGMLCIVGTGVLAHRQFAGEPGLEVLYNAPPFDLIDQNGRQATEAIVKGNVYVAMVFFASCPGACPVMNGRMKELQDAVPLPDVKIISISVDPKNDKPEVLKVYAEGYGVDSSRWYMLTGEKEAVFATAKAFGLAAAPAEEGKMATHSNKVLLIDRQNRVRGIYDSQDAAEMATLTRDALRPGDLDEGDPFVNGKEVLAAINATLNSTSVILLIAGYLMIRKGQWLNHARLMVAALCTSALFLVFYITSYVIYDDRSSGLDPSPLRTFYYILLFTHVVLAVGMLPPILMTVFRAYRRRWDAHKRLARPTLWVWLYVSVTGVIVYFMLYHLFPSMKS